MGYSCQLLKSNCWAYEGAATSTAAAMEDERITEGVEKIKRSCKVSITSALQPRLVEYIVFSAVRCSRGCNRR